MDLTNFTDEIKKYSNDFFPELNSDNIVESIVNDKDILNAKTIVNKLINNVFLEFRNNIALIFKIIGISVLCVVIKSIQSNFGESGISEIAFYACYILIIILIMTSFTNIVELCKNTIHILTGFIEFLIPIIISFLAVSGKLTTIATIQPVLLAMISIITVIFTNVIIPIILISTVINIISNISAYVTIKNIGEFLRKIAMWCIEIILVLFVGILSLEGTLAGSVDNLTVKTTKSVVSNAVPIVGKLLGDTVDTVLGGIAVTKNAVGTIGIIAMIAIVITPLIRVLILMGTFSMASALIEPIADGRIVKCMTGVSASIKTLFAIMVTITFLFIISVSLMIKISG